MPKNSTKEYYEKNYRIWSEKKTDSFYHEKSFISFSDLLKDKDRVIDIGCAWGIHVPLFLGIGRKLRYEGLDIANSFLKLARRRYPQLTFHQGDVADGKSLPRKKYDGFWAGSVLMHVPLEKWEAMFDNLERLTNPGAIGYLSLPTEHPSGDRVDSDSRHFTILSAAEQKKIIKRRGWNILRSGSMNGFTKPGIWRWYIVRLP